MRWLIIALVFYQAYAANNQQRPCTLPPGKQSSKTITYDISDFWCDTPHVAIACTGSLKYCDQYRRSRLNRPTEIHLAFESGCPDSQRFIVDRMYPKVLNNSYVSQLVDFKAYPYGLAKRETAEKINCHHGERECSGNRLLTCMNNLFANDKRLNAEAFYCFMSLMHNKQLEPEQVMQACLYKTGVSPAMMQTIV